MSDKAYNSAMEIKTKIAVRVFGSAIALAKFYGVHRQTIYDWGEYLPEYRVLQLEKRRNDIYDAIVQGDYDEDVKP